MYEFLLAEPHLDADKTTDIEKKRRICQSVGTSGFFATTYRDAVDMDEIYLDLKSEVEKEKKHKGGTPNIYYRMILEHYQGKSCWRGAACYLYTTILTTFDVHDSKVKEEEHAFACAVRHHYTRVLIIFFISDAYNINTDLSMITDRQISARFVCIASLDRCNLAALAEESAKAFGSLEYSVEDIYLRMRRFHNMGRFTVIS